MVKSPAAEVKPSQASTAASTAALPNKATTGDEALQPSTKATPNPSTPMLCSADAPPDAPNTPPQKDNDVAKEEITVAGVQYTWPTESLMTSSSRSSKASSAKEQPLSVSGSPSDSGPQKGPVSEGSAAAAAEHVDGDGEVGVPKTTAETLGAVRPEPAAEGKAGLPTGTAALGKKSKKKKKKSGSPQDLHQGPEDDDKWIPVTRGRRN